MDKLKAKLAALKEERAGILAKENITDEERARVDAINVEVRSVLEEIRVRAESEKLDRESAQSTGTLVAQVDMGDTRGSIEVGKDLEAEKPFANLGEQLRCIYRAATDPTRHIDKRLLRLNEQKRAILGVNEQVGSEGGFALQDQFAGAIFETAVSTGDVTSRVDNYPIGAGSNAARWVEIEETSVASTIFGGVQVYWAAEGAAVSATKPTMKERRLELEKLFGLAYATGEMLEDTAFVSSLFTKAFSTAIQRKLDIDIINGTGVGCPLGILNADCAIEVAKEVGQGADTVMYPNIVKMWHRLHPSMRSMAVWLVHPDTEEQMEFMSFPVGTGGVPVYLPAGGVSESGYATLKGRPVVATDACAALGDPGDIILANLSEYMLISKGNMREDTSIHVAFTTDQQAFRFIYRVNGKPKPASALTIRNSSNTRSAFVTLAERA